MPDFKNLIRKIKELRVSGSGEIIVPTEQEDALKFIDTIPFSAREFSKLNTDEKEALFIWLHKDDMPQELKRKRLEQQVLYLKSELEETQWIFQDCLREFDVEFRKYFKEPTKQVKGENAINSPEYDIPIEDVNSVFKKIAKHTHPDKLINKNISDEEYDAKVDMYKEAQKSVKNRDWSKVVEIAKE